MPKPLQSHSIEGLTRQRHAETAKVISDLCAYVKENKHIVNSGQTKLVQSHGNDELSGRYSKRMPIPLKVVAGEADGIDYHELAA